MILKTFVKINKGGVLADPNGINKYYESDEIKLSAVDRDKNTVSFELFVKGVGDYMPIRGEINLDKYGYELISSNGAVIDRYISKSNLT